MQLRVCDRVIELEKLTPSEYKEILPTGENILVLGKPGIGKSKIPEEFAPKQGKKILIISLAMEMPETIGGVPYAQITKDGKVDYFKKILNERLAPVFKDKGKDWILFFDEINQASPEVLNALYSICHIDPSQRHWEGHSLENAQVIAAGNTADGSSGTVYLTDLPGPLLDRFTPYELVANRKDTETYLAEKWANKVPGVKRYITELLDQGIPPRDTELTLSRISKMIACEYTQAQLTILLRGKLTTPLAQKILEMKDAIDKDEAFKNMDPTKKLKRAKAAYQALKTYGSVEWNLEQIETEAELTRIFTTEFGLSEEEIASITKGE